MSEEINPFQSPQAMGAAAIPSPTTGFVPADRRAGLAVALLLAVMVANLVSAGSTWLQIGLLERAQAGVQLSRVEIQGNDVRQALVQRLGAAMYLISGGTFILWLFRASRNLRALGNQSVEYSPGWAIGAWFIPIGNLFIPYQVTAEIWNRSHPANVQTRHAVRAPGLSLVRWWWALFLAMNLLAWATVPWTAGGRTTIASLLASSWLLIIRNLLELPAAFFAIQVVSRIKANQQERYRLFEEMKSNMPQPADAAGSPFGTPLAAGAGNAGAADDFPFLPPPKASSRAEPPGKMPTPWLDTE